jgi:predicted RNase H-like HicB family nuclease
VSGKRKFKEGARNMSAKGEGEMKPSSLGTVEVRVSRPDLPPSLRVTIVVTKEEDGYVARCVEIPGVIGDGDTFKEATASVKDGIKFHLETFGPEVVPTQYRDRQNPDGTITPLTIPNHRRYRKGTLRIALTEAGIERDDFLNAYYGR